ncbi:hypothetical protein P4O66_008173 [Electrophorus voltai]|uniref:Uncharacterized protein n=1 Tax=Electrophorus voltai TaxID=2609070 RepID=A0AAD8ZE38_9TELE|nr:hypothetical protein P4O66_008173 [Electrophorus voltai]
MKMEKSSLHLLHAEEWSPARPGPEAWTPSLLTHRLIQECLRSWSFMDFPSTPSTLRSVPMTSTLPGALHRAAQINTSTAAPLSLKQSIKLPRLLFTRPVDVPAAVSPSRSEAILVAPPKSLLHQVEGVAEGDG